MDHQHYLDLVAQFRNKRVLVVGDIYLDENVFGSVTEVSLEAPIPVYEVHKRKHNPGAAGNAACNVASLGATTYMVGYVGDDVNAGIVRKEFDVRNVDTSGVVVHPERPTNTYGKLRAGGFNIPTQEILRTDTPRPTFITGAVEDQVIANIRARAPEVDAIVAVDQVSSVCTERVLAVIVETAKKHNLLTVGDSRARAGALKGFEVIVPNDREAGIGAGIDVTDVDSLHKAAKTLLGVAKNAVITRGGDGISVFAADGSVADVPVTVSPGSVVDVTGAGDTVTAAVTLTLLAGGSLEDAAYIGNVAAGVAVIQPGVVTVSGEDVVREIEGGNRPAKLKTLPELKKVIARLKDEEKEVVWTNGCFDIIHVGHITYLQRARAAGDALVVGLNSDRSVRELKGPDRPVIEEADRAMVLAALECVDYIIIFEGEHPTELIAELQPDVYAKGGDYTIDTIVQEERRLVEGYGGRIHIVPGVEGRSTTGIIARVKS